MLKNFFSKTFLGRLYTTDPILAKGISVILILYICIHIFRLELFPLYMFAMFSKQETPKELYQTYKFYENDREINLNNWDFRKYTVFMNTVIQYDGILENNMKHPEVEAIEKFITRLRLKDSSLEKSLKGPYNVSREQLQDKIGLWVSKELNIQKKDLRIDRVSYSWTTPKPQWNKKITIYGMDQ